MVLLVALAACGDDDDRRHPDASDDTDTRDVAAPDGATDLDASDDTLAPADSSPADASDVSEADAPDAPDVPQVPIACDDGHACNALLDGDGLCPGACFAVPDALVCRGEVVHGVCHRSVPPQIPTEAVDFGDFRVTPVQWPRDATLGETYPLELRLDNDTPTELSLRFAWKHPDTFTFAEVSWDGLTTLTVPASGSLALTANITAALPTVLTAGEIIVTLDFGDAGRFEPRSVVHFDASAPIVCGDERFPEMWCPDETNCYASRSFYVSARCCDGVFFPGALCCQDADCVGSGACVDGRCVDQVPHLGSASSLPLGHQRIALVLVDSHPEFEDDPCADRSAIVQPAIDLATVDAWFDALAVRRFGRPTMDIRWTVLGGVQTADFLGDAPNDFQTFSTRLDAWLSDRGCPLLDAYDKVIVSASTVNLLGFGGVYFDHGKIGVFSPFSPYLLAHELGHAFGATDLYLDLGGSLHYAFDLMGNNLQPEPYPEDGVIWGQVGFGDVDRDGVIDIAQHAAFPDSIDLADVSATLTKKNTLEVAFRFVGLEGGVAKDVVITDFHVTLPVAGYDADTYHPFRVKRVIFDGTQVDLDALRTAGSLELGVAARHRFTDRTWQGVTRTLDTTRTIPITVME